MKFLTLAGLMVAASVASAQNAYFTGSLNSGDGTWIRPKESGASSSGTSVFFDVQPFYVLASGTFTFESVAPTPGDYDTFIFIYQNTFNPATPLANFVSGNDDFSGSFSILPGPYAVPASGTGAAGTAPSSQIFNVALTSGTQYYAVNSSFSTGAAGTYFSGIGGVGASGAPVDVILGTVPEPASLAALGIGAVALLRRRRRA